MRKLEWPREFRLPHVKLRLPPLRTRLYSVVAREYPTVLQVWAPPDEDSSKDISWTLTRYIQYIDK